MPFPVRLLVGLIKGIVVGGLIGFALAAAGAGTLSGWIAYPMAAVAGALIATIAGWPNRRAETDSTRWSRRCECSRKIFREGRLGS